MITVEHSAIGPSIAVTGDDMYRLPALYYAGLYEPQYPVPTLIGNVDWYANLQSNGKGGLAIWSAGGLVDRSLINAWYEV